MKKNKVFVNEIHKRIGNNQSYYDINNLKDEPIVKEDNEEIISELTVEEKLDKLFKINGYVFNVDVIIITKNHEYHTKIAGKVNNHLITLDNDVININDIEDIIIKEIG